MIAPSPPHARPPRPLFVLAALAGLCAPAAGEPPVNPLDAQRAFAYLEEICKLGPRYSGSVGMLRQRQLVTKHFTDLGARVREQTFPWRHPLTGERVPMTNLIVEWHPEKKDRILLCAHYDTRPKPDNDPNPRLRETGTFIGANDGASGVAVLMELAHLMPDLDVEHGVDFVLFDGEELVYGAPDDPQRGEYFVGSTIFAQEYRRRPPAHRYRWGVLLDMVGDADLQLYQEKHSMQWASSRRLVTSLWNTAQRLGVEEFIPRAGYAVLDDHLPLNQIARIPTCNIIDFDYPEHPDNVYWHSVEDTPDKCSGESLAKVGWVVYEWLKTAR